MESAITSKGQATIPKAIREHLRAELHDRGRLPETFQWAEAFH